MSQQPDPRVTYAGHSDHSSAQPAPRLVFSHDDLSVYERIDPDEFPDFDEVDSRDVGEPGGWLDPRGSGGD